MHFSTLTQWCHILCSLCRLDTNFSLLERYYCGEIYGRSMTTIAVTPYLSAFESERAADKWSEIWFLLSLQCIELIWDKSYRRSRCIFKWMCHGSVDAAATSMATTLISSHTFYAKMICNTMNYTLVCVMILVFVFVLLLCANWAQEHSLILNLLPILFHAEKTQ